MNYLAHGIPFLDDPYCLAGTAVPDWLGVVDRRVKIRRVQAEAFLEDSEWQLRALARGILQHYEDDKRFHATAAFQQLCWELTARVRDAVEQDRGMRPALVGHILVEVLVDAELARQHPHLLPAYYRTLSAVDPAQLQRALRRMAPRPVEGCDRFLGRFLHEKFLYDYAEDGKLLMRLNQVMRRVGLPELPATVGDVLPSGRRQVAQQLGELLPTALRRFS